MILMENCIFTRHTEGRSIITSDDCQAHSILLREIARIVYDSFNCVLSETQLIPLATNDCSNNQCASERQTDWNKAKVS